MKCAIYIRVSSQEQTMHGYSLEAQEELLRNYAQQNGMDVYDLYADRGKSANKSLHKRTELLRMVKDAEDGKFQIIAFKDITRWSRNSSQYWKIQDRLDRCGVSWVAVEQPYLETRTPTGKFQVTVMLGTAQLESENTSQRIRFVQEHRAEQGGVLSGNVPLGYKIEQINGMKRLVIDPEKRDMVNDLFRYYTRCRNQAATIDYIAEKYGVRIWASRMNTLLKNPIYKGEYRSNPDYCEPYLTASEWSMVQSYWQVRQPSKHNDLYIFRSLIRCPECGHVLTANYRHNTVYYRCCYSAVQHRCGYRKQHRQDAIEADLLEQISFALDNTDIFDADVQDEQDDINPRIEKLNRKLSNLKELYIDGDIDKASYIARRDSLKDEISRLESTQRKSSKPPIDMLETPWRDLYNSKTELERGEWWRFVLERIDITDNGFVPTYRNYAL